jgi:biotin carboxyl carrier protein
MKITFGAQSIELTPKGGNYTASLGDQTVLVEIVRAEDGRLDLLVDGRRVIAHVTSDGARRWVTVEGRTMLLTKSSGARRTGAGHEHASGLTAPMPGQVRSANVRAGEAVTKGQTLLVIEAMKMEIRIQSPRDGTVRKLFVEPGQTVEREQILIEIEGTSH